MSLWRQMQAMIVGGLLGTLAPLAALAEIRTTTLERDYRVRGSDAKALVRYMRVRPFAGDNGPAMANIRPRYDLTVATRPGLRKDRRKKPPDRRAKGCHVDKVRLSIRFVMTLPDAVHEDRLDRRTRRAWRSFRAFTRRHEQVHRRLYMRCARGFLRKAARMETQSGCSSLKREVRRLLDAEDKACNRLHDAFDRRDFPRVPHMTLFRMARQAQLAKRFATRRAPSRRTPGRVATASRRTWFDATPASLASPGLSTRTPPLMSPVRLRGSDLR